jgi:hypothetical protein
LEEGACQHTERINARKLEQYVMNTVMDKILTPDMVQSWLSEMQARLASPEAPAQIEALDKEIVRLKVIVLKLVGGEGGAIARRIAPFPPSTVFRRRRRPDPRRRHPEGCQPRRSGG